MAKKLGHCGEKKDTGLRQYDEKVESFGEKEDTGLRQYDEKVESLWRKSWVIVANRCMDATYKNTALIQDVCR